jgi:hypothetical protein
MVVMSYNKVEEDAEARKALWAAVLDGATKLAGKCTVYISGSPSIGSKINPQIPIPDVQTWQLVEALSLLAILIKAEAVITSEIPNLFGKTGPLHFIEDGHDRYLWAQPSLRGQESALGGRPDLVVTATPDAPSALNIMRVIECKCRKRLGAPDIRGEFGKAHDLQVTSYLIWSFNTPSLSIIEGAKRLGLDIQPLGFDTDRRADLISVPENLVMHVANTQEVSRRGNQFARILLESSNNASLKVFK